MNYVIGGGGGGTMLLPPLVRFVGRDNVTIVDGDSFERKNMDRQLFEEKDLGRNKAEALGEMYGIAHIPEYFHSGLMRFSPGDVIFCNADNHTCRREVLAACDMYGCRACICGNGYRDAEAYWYQPSFKDTHSDPRVVYPTLLTDHSDDPLGPPGCVEESVKSPQLVLANFWAVSAQLSLFYFWTVTRDEFPDDTMDDWPVHITINPLRTRTIRYGDRKPN